MASEGKAREELKAKASVLARAKIMEEIGAPLAELAEKRAKLKRLRRKVDELKEVTGKLSTRR